MARQTRPFIVEIKTSRKVKPTDRKTSIWGGVDLRTDESQPVTVQDAETPAIPTEDGRS